MKKVIATDVDGVLLNWESRLEDFFKENGTEKDLENLSTYLNNYKISSFNDLFSGQYELIADYNSDKKYGGSLEVIKESLILNDLKKDYDIVAVTAFGVSEESKKIRLDNLNKYFPNVFKEVLFVNSNESKIKHFEYLNKEYNGKLNCYVDDMVKNILTFDEVNQGANNIYIKRYKGEDHKLENKNVKIVNGWNDIVKNHLEVKKVRRFKM